MRDKNFWNFIVTNARNTIEKDKDLEEGITKSKNMWHMLAGCCERPRIILAYLTPENRKWLREMREKYGQDEIESFIIGFNSLSMRIRMDPDKDIKSILEDRFKNCKHKRYEIEDINESNIESEKEIS